HWQAISTLQLGLTMNNQTHCHFRYRLTADECFRFYITVTIGTGSLITLRGSQLEFLVLPFVAMKRPKIYIFAFLLLLLNSAYLWPLADPTLFYMSNLILHMGLGTLLAAVVLRYLSRNFAILAGWLRWGF